MSSPEGKVEAISAAVMINFSSLEVSGLIFGFGGITSGAGVSALGVLVGLAFAGRVSATGEASAFDCVVGAGAAGGAVSWNSGSVVAESVGY